MESPAMVPDRAERAAPRGAASAGTATDSWRLALAALWTLTILVLCWTPAPIVGRLEEGQSWFLLLVPNFDKVVHWGIFFVFTILWLRTGTSGWRYAWVALGGLALAAITEVVQNLPAIGRDGSAADAATDAIGVAIGLAAAHWVEPMLSRAESRLFRSSTAVGGR